MEKFNSPETYKLKDLEPGKYNLISLRKIETKFGDTVIARLDVNDEEKDFYLKKSHAKLTDHDIEEINNGNYIFHFKGKINDLYYDYKLQRFSNGF